MLQVKEPLLSICIPIYNAGKYLNECIEPLIKMKAHDVQIILSDDGSTDDSLTICQRFAERHENIYIVRGENGGPSAARNRALDKVTGRYVVFCDADDWLETRTADELKSVLKKYDIETRSGKLEIPDLIQFGVTVENGGVEQKQKLLYSNSRILAKDDFFDLFCLTCGYRDGRDLPFASYGLVTCKIYRTELIRDLKFDPEIVGEDTLYAVEAMQRVRNAYWLAENLYHYRVVPGSYSHKLFQGIVPMAVKMVQRLERAMMTAIERCNFEKTEILRQAWYQHCFDKMVWCFEGTGIRNIESRKEKTHALRRICEIPEFRNAIVNIETKHIARRTKIAAWLMRLGIYRAVIRCLRL